MQLVRRFEAADILAALRRLPLKSLSLSLSAVLSCVAASFTSFVPVSAQSSQRSISGHSGSVPIVAYEDLADANLATEGSGLSLAGPTSGMESDREPEPPLPNEPEPAGPGGNPERYTVPYAAEWRQPPFSRIGIGADLSPLGIGVKSAIVLNQVLDARFMASFLSYNSNRFEIAGFNIYANIHMASAATLVDLYPFNSVWRASAGLMFLNGNQLSAVTRVAPGTSFTLEKATFYSSNADPVSGNVVLGLNTVRPSPMVSFGFGKFIPRSNRHWSFPAEFGAVYIGAPSLTVKLAGTVCTDKLQTVCSNIGNQSNSVGSSFNQNLQTRLAIWRKDLAKVQFYPILSVSVVYSFNIR